MQNRTRNLKQKRKEKKARKYHADAVYMGRGKLSARNGCKHRNMRLQSKLTKKKEVILCQN